MSLSVPGWKMEHELSTFRFRFVEIGIGLGKGTKEFAVPPFEVQTKRSVEGVPGFVSQNAHALLVRAALHFQHLLAFEFYQSGMREIKRNRYPRNTVRGKPLA